MYAASSVLEMLVSPLDDVQIAIGSCAFNPIDVFTNALQTLDSLYQFQVSNSSKLCNQVAFGDLK